MATRRYRYLYSVYDRKTDMPVMIAGTAEECAAAMGITLNIFRTICSKTWKGTRTSKRWEIFRDVPVITEEDYEHE